MFFWIDVYLLDPDSKVKLNVISHQFNPKSVDFDQICIFYQNPVFDQNLRFSPKSVEV